MNIRTTPDQSRAGWPREALDETQRLEDRIAELEDAFGLTLLVPSRVFPSLGLEPGAERVLGVLLARPMCSRDALFMILYGDRPECDQPQPIIIDLYISRIRGSLRMLVPQVEVLNRHGKGWLIVDQHKAKLREFLRLPA